MAPDPILAAARTGPDSGTAPTTTDAVSPWALGLRGLRARWRLVLMAVVGSMLAAALLLPRACAPADSDGLASGNGRLEALPIDVAVKSGGRIAELLADEGDDVAAGQVLARMDVRTELAQQREAEAQQRRAGSARDSADAAIAQRRSALATSEALILQRRSELDLAERQARRSTELASSGAASTRQAEEDRAHRLSAQAALAAALAARAEALAGVRAAEAGRAEADAAIEAIAAQVQRLQVQIDDGVLRAPRAGRVQYRVAQAGEVVASGGKVLSLVDLTEIYINIFLPEADADRIAVGDEARIVLDAAPDQPVSAHVAFISAVAQFTPKSVETAEERAKLMFRVKLRIDRERLARAPGRYRSGAPGIAYVRVAQQPWPAWLQATAP